MEDFNKKIIDEFRKNKGKVGGMFAGMQLLLMTTKGAKSGKELVVPVAYTKNGENYVVIASKGGAPTNPAWYYNLLAHPEIMVEVEDELFKARAVEVTGTERDRLYSMQETVYPNFKE